ncbi:hypothetical protein [Leeia aquatica]|uniref:Uncharacterized protein n=1 Tax=Leeia aquatica TaxID=2725557 RepID=A0A847RWN4_9NEIS|nr:hypothetical protein [Leeia aquatica]NLR75570.1 hypothetical protein [Leeia aquatica]
MKRWWGWIILGLIGMLLTAFSSMLLTLPINMGGPMAMDLGSWLGWGLLLPSASCLLFGLLRPVQLDTRSVLLGIAALVLHGFSFYLMQPLLDAPAVGLLLWVLRRHPLQPLHVCLLLLASGVTLLPVALNFLDMPPITDGAFFYARYHDPMYLSQPAAYFAAPLVVLQLLWGHWLQARHQQGLTPTGAWASHLLLGSLLIGGYALFIQHGVYQTPIQRLSQPDGSTLLQPAAGPWPALLLSAGLMLIILLAFYWRRRSLWARNLLPFSLQALLLVVSTTWLYAATPEL